MGSLFLLSTAEDVADFERALERQKALGVPSRMLLVEEARRATTTVNHSGELPLAQGVDFSV